MFYRLISLLGLFLAPHLLLDAQNTPS
ncbi:MAG: hypothetical protein RLZ62_1859, partial [Bacteroidota bacterium]